MIYRFRLRAKSFIFFNIRYIVKGIYENIVLFDLEEGKTIRNAFTLGKSKVTIILILKFHHSKYGECLINVVIKFGLIKNDKS